MAELAKVVAPDQATEWTRMTKELIAAGYSRVEYISPTIDDPPMVQRYGNHLKAFWSGPEPSFQQDFMRIAGECGYGYCGAAGDDYHRVLRSPGRS